MTNDPLSEFRLRCHSPADAVRWACVLEATAPKAGNVYPGRSFADLRYQDFIVAAEIAATCLGDGQPFSRQILQAVIETKQQTGTNVNLGILLLLGPLVAADHTKAAQEDWVDAIARVLASIGPAESREIFVAIARASAGGLGKVDQMDVDDQQSHDDIVAAMRLAAPYDRIALQYAHGFADLLHNILPIVYDSLSQSGDVLHGIMVAHLRLLAAAPDSLIARKQGSEVAERVRGLAAAVDVDDLAACQRFDESLRRDGHKLNPGTTADLIAAALFLLLRTHPSK